MPDTHDEAPFWVKFETKSDTDGLGAKFGLGEKKVIKKFITYFNREIVKHDCAFKPDLEPFASCNQTALHLSYLFL